jgi:hypothetical protein
MIHPALLIFHWDMHALIKKKTDNRVTSTLPPQEKGLLAHPFSYHNG